MRELTQQEQNILLSVFHLKEQAHLLAIRNHLKDITGKELAIATIYVPLERLAKLGYLKTTLSNPSRRSAAVRSNIIGLPMRGSQF